MIQQLVKIQLFKNGMYFDIFISKLDWIFHGIIDNSGWKGPQEVCGPLSYLKWGQHTRLLRALPNQLLKICKDRDITTSPDNRENVFSYI